MKVHTVPNATHDSKVMNEDNTNVIATDSNEKKDEIKPVDPDVMRRSNTVSPSANAAASSTNINATELTTEKVAHLLYTFLSLIIFTNI